MGNYFREIIKELKQSSFPSQATVINFTLFVIIFTAVMAVYLGALDLGFGEATLKGIEYGQETYGTSNIKVEDVIIDATTTPATSTATTTN